MFERPDWKNRAIYRVIENASLQRIAWEFLRRNTDYQIAWDKYAKLVREMAATDDEVTRYVELVLSNCESLEKWAALGDRDKINDLSSRLGEMGHLHQLPDKPLRYVALDLHYGAPWGLNRIVSPSTNYGGFKVRFSDTASTVSVPIANFIDADKAAPQGTGLRDTKWLTVQIDLTLPLKVIDAQLKKIVRQKRQSKVREGNVTPITSRDVSPKKYAEYLRILDARASGLSAPEIGRAMEPRRINDGDARQRDKRYSAALKKAERLQKEGYRTLPLLEFLSHPK